MGRTCRSAEFLAVEESEIARRRTIERRDIDYAARMRRLRHEFRAGQCGDLIKRETPRMS
jgi:hypothetical protein